MLTLRREGGSSRTKDRTHVSCIGRQILYLWAARKAPQRRFLSTLDAESAPDMSQLLTFRAGCPWSWRQNPGLGLGTSLSLLPSPLCEAAVCRPCSLADTVSPASWPTPLCAVSGRNLLAGICVPVSHSWLCGPERPLLGRRRLRFLV